MKQQTLCATKCIGQLKLRTQLVIIVSIQVVIIVSYVLALNLIHHSLLLNYLSEVSDYLFEQNSDHLLSNMMREYYEHFNQVFNLSKPLVNILDGNALVSFHRLYHTSKNQVLLHPLEINPIYQMKYGGTTKIPDPLRIIKGYGNYDISYSFMCYSNLSSYNQPKTIEEIVGIKLQEQLQAAAQIFYQGNLINQSFLYSYIIKEKINSIYPCLNRDKAIYQYVAENRDWYIELKRNYQIQLHIHSTIFMYQFPPQICIVYTDKKIGLSMTLPIVDQELKLIGGVVSNFLGSQIIEMLKVNSFGFQIIYLVSEKGVMIMHPYKVTVEQLPLYIYNESITGFNQTDWEYIQNLNNESTCPQFVEISSFLRCRFNSYYKQEMIIGTREFPQFKMKLIMLLSSQEYLKFYDDFRSTLEQQLHKTTTSHIIWLFALFVALCFMIVVVTQILFNPIDIIKQQAIHLIIQQRKRRQQISQLAEVLMSDEISSLVQAYQIVINKLESLSLTKTSLCKQIEDIQYPTKQPSATQSENRQSIQETKKFQALKFQYLKDLGTNQQFERAAISIIRTVLNQKNTNFLLY
ncbi:unnamed protein product (macronuclear) [Paramecium tetraurelia]|uniref:Cache domain-containing protein n=1 Tax=Paramecium tetraurelia TaxID=5888 RepID=A0BTN5_PARTE|nr:uncharacterized protein GSPATT00032134001 [Paramecium tetraurelia]CAK61902.1 unnamed protein product [Paramecium tetraurelia]|eukprot:XP_001429300.1 hypothetical protein (macronuclear) [Paramecium tetraurelia strain d4-2]